MGVDVIAYSSDGDSRYFSVMKDFIKFGITSRRYGFICPIDFESDTVVFQDTPHKVNNLKNKFMDRAANLQIGKYNVTPTHLESLMTKVPKNLHLMHEKDVKILDRMDYSVVKRIATENVCSLLRKHVPNSEGTSAFLTVLRLLLEAFTSPELAPLERIYKAFYSLFFFRFWRCWCTTSSEVSLENFVTCEAYVSIEINSWCLLKLLEQCKQRFGSDAFKPDMYNSQNCENFFRLLRSLTTTLCTMVNFSSLDVMQRVQRINVMNSIMHELKNFKFRKSFGVDLKDDTIGDNLPSEFEVQQTLIKAYFEVKDVVEKLGVVIEDSAFTSISQFIRYTPVEDLKIRRKIKINDQSQKPIENSDIFEFEDLKFVNEVSGNTIKNRNT